MGGETNEIPPKGMEHIDNPQLYLDRAIRPTLPKPKKDEKVTYEVQFCPTSVSKYIDINGDGLDREIFGQGVVVKRNDRGIWSGTETTFKPFLFLIRDRTPTDEASKDPNSIDVDDFHVVWTGLDGSPLEKAAFGTYYVERTDMESPGRTLSSRIDNPCGFGVYGGGLVHHMEYYVKNLVRSENGKPETNEIYVRDISYVQRDGNGVATEYHVNMMLNGPDLIILPNKKGERRPTITTKVMKDFSITDQ